MKAQKLNRKQVCQVLYLLRFDFTLKHVPGTKMGKVDRFSRRPDWKVETDNSNQMLIKKARSKDEEVVRVVERDEEGRSKSIIRR